MTIEEQFGKRVRTLRQNLNVSQDEFAYMCHLHRNYISDLERGRRNVSLRAIKQIADGLGVEIATLFKE
ncbi:MAG: helix-turn-helix transcriptional regulator [Bacilli bacterium]|nr:helix-turn-helix transcriptional regulator [Bacilli bacterium]